MRHWCVAWLSPVPISRFSVVSGSPFVLQCCLELSPLFRDAPVVSRVLLPAALLMEPSTSSSEKLQHSPVCLPETSLSIHHLSVIRLAGRSDCLRFFLPPRPPLRFIDRLDS